MRIDIWFDFTCPFSYIGKRRFEKAVNNYINKKDVNIYFHSFCIAPYIEGTLCIDAHQYLSEHKDIPYKKAQEVHHRLTVMAQHENIKLDFDNLIPTTSKKAHQVLKLFTDSVALSVFIDIVFKAHFEEGKDISDPKVLAKIGALVGLVENDVIAVCETDMYTHEIRLDYQRAENLNLTGVPAFVVDNSYYLLGAQPKEAFSEMLNSFYRKQKSEVTKTECIGDECQREK